MLNIHWKQGCTAAECQRTACTPRSCWECCLLVYSPSNSNKPKASSSTIENKKCIYRSIYSLVQERTVIHLLWSPNIFDAIQSPLLWWKPFNNQIHSIKWLQRTTTCQLVTKEKKQMTWINEKRHCINNKTTIPERIGPLSSREPSTSTAKYPMCLPHPASNVIVQPFVQRMLG